MKTPEQYKKQAEKLIHTIGKMADKLYPIMTELGDSVEIEANNCVVEIKKQKNDEIANEPTLEWYIKRNKEYVEVRKILYKYYQQTSSDCAYPDEVRKIMESINITDNSKEQAIQAGNTRPDVTIDEEKVVCAAIKLVNGKIYRGHRHNHCFNAIQDERQDHKNAMQGFMTTKNRFVDRKEAMKIQNKAGIKSVWTIGYIGNILFSEDLY